jgi:hypothetical protein
VSIRALKAAVLMIVLYILLLIVYILLLNSAGSTEIGIGYRRGLEDAAEGYRVSLGHKV